MFCIRCGQPVPPDSAFCTHCGQAIPVQGGQQQPPTAMPGPAWQSPVCSERPMMPSQNYYAPPMQQSYGELRSKKKKTGLIVGLSVSGAVLLAIIVVLLFVWPGLLKTVSVMGVWYSDSRGEAIVFGSGHSFDAYTYYGDFEGDYEFDKSSGEGHIDMDDDREFDFVINNGELYVYDMGVFSKADDRFDIKDFIEKAKRE